MKRVLIEKVKPVPLPKAYKYVWGTTAQRIQIEADDMLLLDIYIKGTYTARHCVNLESGEYATWFAASDGFSSPYPMVGQDAIWTGNRISYPYTSGKYYDSYNFDWGKEWKEITKLAGKKNEKVIKGILDEAKQEREKKQLKGRYSYTFPLIPTLENWRVYFSDLESKYSGDKRALAEDRRIKRVNDVMDMVPEIPDEFGEWVYGQMFDGVPGEALYEVSTKKWVCSECHNRIDRDDILDEKGSRVKMNKTGFCPVCGEKITLHRKTKQYDKTIRYSMKACVFNAIGDSMGVVRYFDAEAWSSTRQEPEDPKGKNMDIMETIRIVLPKLNNAGQQIRKVLLKKKDAECRIYYRDFHGFFDKILVDAPCSGEGMFRREAGMSAYWNEKGPEYYAPLQADILARAVSMLKPGGYLMYSTCTFSPLENEANVLSLTKRFPALELLDIPEEEGFSRGVLPGSEKCVRIYPHRMRGEGQFMALFVKRDLGSAQLVVEGSALASGGRRSASAKRSIYEKNDEIYLIPGGIRPYPSLRYLMTGLHLATRKKNRINVSQALAEALREGEWGREFNMNAGDIRVEKYLRGETLYADDSEIVAHEPSLTRIFGGVDPAVLFTAPAGGRKAARDKSPDRNILILIEGFPVGFGTFDRGLIKNKRAPGRRVL